MSLVKAVEAIADEMEQEMIDLKAVYRDQEVDMTDEVLLTMKQYAKMIRIAVKSADSPPVQPVFLPPQQVMGIAQQSPFADEMFHRQMIEAQKMKMQQDKNPAEPDGGEMMLDVIHADGTVDNAMVDCKMPKGANTNIGGCVYQLRDDNKLHFVKKLL